MFIKENDFEYSMPNNQVTAVIPFGNFKFIILILVFKLN